MSEQLSLKHENKFENLAELSQDLEARPPLPEHGTPDKPEVRAETIRSATEQANQVAEKDNPLEKFVAAQAAEAPAQHTFVDESLKKLTRKRELQHIQHQLPKTERTFSKVVHQPAIRLVSEGASKTLSRPSGLLGGGIMAFIGTSAYVYFTKHVGLQYNYLLFALFFVGGFAVGIVIELIIRVLRSTQNSSTS